MIGVHPSEARLPLHLDDFHPRNLSLVGVYGGRGHVPAAAQWLAHLDIEPLIGRRFELADINTAFDVARSGRSLRCWSAPASARASNQRWSAGISWIYWTHGL